MLKLVYEGSAENVGRIAAFIATLNTTTAITVAAAPPPGPPLQIGHGTMPNPAPEHVDDDNGPANSNAPAIDTAGLPWDERIHSKNKGMNADGTWRKKRGVDGAVVAAVEGELRLRSAQSAGMYMPPPSQPAMQPPPAPQPMQQQYMPPPAPQQYAPPPAPMQQQYMPPPAPQPAQMDFQAFMQHLSGQMQKRDVNGAPLITTDYLAGLCQRLSAHLQRAVNSITEIGNDPNAINAAVSFIASDGRWN